MFGYEREGNLSDASRSADELIRVEPDSVRYHQKRVEYAVRANDKPQLVDAYLSLAESLFRSGQLDKSRAVYGRVVELAPSDARAASALRELGVEIEPPIPEPLAAQPQAASAPAADTKQRAPEPAKAPPEPVPLAVEVERTSSTLPIDEELFAALETALPEPPQRAPAPVFPQRPPIAAGERRELRQPRRLAARRRGAEEHAHGRRRTRRSRRSSRTSRTCSGSSSRASPTNVDDEDHQSHYDLGVAYKEMGLLDEAIGEFQKALRGTEHRVPTYEALGQCFIEKEQYQMAVTILLRALNEPAPATTSSSGVLYLLGYASESAAEVGGGGGVLRAGVHGRHPVPRRRRAAVGGRAQGRDDRVRSRTPDATPRSREIQAPVRERLDRVSEELRRIVIAQLPLIEEVNGHLLQMKGKMFRPTLVLLASAVEGSAEPRAITLAAVLELMHLATLVHDDSVDHSALRRGMPTVNSLFSHQVSVIMGDFLYSRAVVELVRASDLEVLRVLTDATNAMTVGEMRQLAALDALGFTEADYEALIRAKTASLLSARVRDRRAGGRALAPRGACALWRAARDGVPGCGRPARLHADGARHRKAVRARSARAQGDACRSSPRCARCLRPSVARSTRCSTRPSRATSRSRAWSRS